MSFWAIVKLIAEIISNLPFDVSRARAEVRSAQWPSSTTTPMSSDEEDRYVAGSAAEVTVARLRRRCDKIGVVIPNSGWEELIKLLGPIILWLMQQFFNKPDQPPIEIGRRVD